MIEVEINPADRDELLKDLGMLKLPELLTGELEPFAREVGMQTGKYAPPVAGSTYVRTAHLSRNWFTELIDPVSVDVGNLARYAGWVHGPEQAEWHGRHGWKRLLDVGEEMISAFMHKIKRKIDLIWN